MKRCSSKWLQVEVEVNDRSYFQLLLRKDDGEIQKLRYNKHIFGAKSLPTCANFALQQCAKDFKADFLEARRVILLNFYQDDLLVSVEYDVKDKVLSRELQKQLMKGIGLKRLRGIRRFSSHLTRSPQYLSRKGRWKATN